MSCPDTKQTGNPSKKAREERETLYHCCLSGYLIRHRLSRYPMVAYPFRVFLPSGAKVELPLFHLSQFNLSILFLFLFSSPISYLAVQLLLNSLALALSCLQAFIFRLRLSARAESGSALNPSSKADCSSRGSCIISS